MRTIGAAAGLAVLWLLMSGVYKPLVIGFGAASVLIAVYVSRRMDAVDGNRIQLALKPISFLRYFIWLLGEIAKANWAVTKIVLSPTMTLRQHLFLTSYSQKTDLGQVIFANSITLTPGTISVEVEEGEFLVHAVNFCDEDLDALAEMDRRVSTTEAVPS